MTVPEPPPARIEAEDELSMSVPVAPDWFRVNVLSPIVTFAERAATESLAAAVQLTMLADVDTVSQEGLPETVQVL